MKIMKEARKLSVESAKKHLEFCDYFDNNGTVCSSSDMDCFECMFYNSGDCITNSIIKHAEKHNCTPEESYAKWRWILEEIVEKGDKPR